MKYAKDINTNLITYLSINFFWIFYIYLLPKRIDFIEIHILLLIVQRSYQFFIWYWSLVMNFLLKSLSENELWIDLFFSHSKASMLFHILNIHSWNIKPGTPYSTIFNIHRLFKFWEMALGILMNPRLDWNSQINK